MRAIVVAAALVLLFGRPAAADERFPCFSVDEYLAIADAGHEPAMVVSGALGAMLAAEHRRAAPVRYEMVHPVGTVLLVLKRDRSVVVALQIGPMACAPLRVSPEIWAEIVLRLRGRRA